MYETTVNASGSVRFWDVFRQSWREMPAWAIPNHILATMNDKERAAIYAVREQESHKR